MNKKGFRYYLFRGCISIGRLFTLLGDFFHQLPTALMPPQKLIEIINIYYTHENRIKNWAKNSGGGLCRYEEEFINHYNISQGDFLVIASGSGREAFGLAKKGFAVTAIDVSEGLIQFSKEKAEKESVKNIDFRCVSLYDFNPEKRFDYIFFTGRCYGMVPTRKMRIEFLKKIKPWLKDNGRLLISFIVGNQYIRGKRRYFYYIYKIIAYLTFGNKEIEKGDLMISEEWHHIFADNEEAISEVKEMGFSIEKVGKEGGNYLFLKPFFIQ